MRITGLASGLDMDQIIKDSMKPYRIKIDKKGQDKEILEIKQKLYREVVKDSREFYNKYFDVAKKDSLLLSSNYATSKFTSSDDTKVIVNGLAGAKVDNYNVVVNQLATSPNVTLSSDNLKNNSIIEINFKGEKKLINISGTTDEKVIAKKINDEISTLGLTAQYSSFAKGIFIEGKETGEKIGDFQNEFTVDIGKEEGNYSINKNSTNGLNAEVTISSDKGIITYDSANVLSKNKVIIDGIELTFNDKTIDGKPVRISGKKDATETKDKLVKFINDYNTLIEKLNTVTTEKRNKNFMPLTADQKKEMSEDEIKLWNEKVQKGQLSKDDDINRISNSMKRAMRSIVDGSGLNLEKIGIKPVADYQGTKNGTFTIDESTLTKALEENEEEVMNLFIKAKPSDNNLSDDKKYAQSGLLQRLKETLYNETVTIASSLLKKAGMEGSSTVYNNEISKSIIKYEQKMKEMEVDFSRREQALYSKYSKLETMMNKYNSQQSYLMQQLGMN